MIKKIIAFLFVVLCPLCGFAFELQDLANYQGVAVKVFVESDSLHKTNNSKSVEVQGTRELVRVLGESKVYYNTEFVYMSGRDVTNATRIKLNAAQAALCLRRRASARQAAKAKELPSKGSGNTAAKRTMTF